MRIKINKSIVTLLVVIISSCNSNYDFKYETHKNEYQESLKCLRKNYSQIFTTSVVERAVSLYPKDFEESTFCGYILKVMQKHSIDFISFDRDSTIAFFKTNNKGIRKKQFILLFIETPEKLNEKLPAGSRIINEIEKGCYVLEREVNIAN